MPSKKAAAKVKLGNDSDEATADVFRTVRFPKPLLKRMKQIALDKEITVQDFILDAVEHALKAEK